ncbi:MAG: hypothetical protein IT585_15040 [candidate division Zixibacteria bacterium]|nr:hypothetical protein [candidate division Zixibacteria bacterium]
MPRLLLQILALMLLTSLVYAQSGRGDRGERDDRSQRGVTRIYSYDNQPPRQLVDCPTAATMPRASFDVQLRASANGSLVGQTTIGLHRRFMVGMSYGGEKILGDVGADWYDEVEFLVKYQLITETIYMPAIALGYEGQGYGRYYNDLKRFMYKSKGFYGVVSKGYKTYQWSSGLHAGAYYSLENDVDNDDDVSVFFGADLQLQDDLLLVAEYDLALSDNRDSELSGKGWGYFNVGIRWIFSERLEIGFDFENLFENRNDTKSPTRGLRITYLEFF